MRGAGEPAVNGGSGNWSNDARPPGGWLTIVMRNVRVCTVAFCAKTTKPRCTVDDSGLAFPGDPTSRPPVIRDV